MRPYEQPDLWERLAERGRRHIEKNFTPEVIAEVINSSVREMGLNEASAPTANHFIETNG